MNTTIFVGLDVHKKTIAVATVAAEAPASVQFFGTVANTPEAIRSMLRKLGKGGQKLHLAYEAGPLGYNLYRLSTGLGHRCDVVAPSLIPRKAGDKIKTDRRDAMMLAQLLRAGQLTEVWVPDEAHEAMRDLVRMRAQAMKDLRKTRQQLHSFLLRHARVFEGKHWTKAHRRWLGELKFAHAAQHLVLEELLARIERAEELNDRLKKAIVELVPQWTLAPVVAAVQALRGVSILVAATVVAEVGNFSRFESPRQLMAYLGLNPSEHSSGATIKRGSITKTGNSLPDTRNPLLVTHTYADMVTARMIAIACGYEDADDLDALRHDPALKIAIERAPESGAGLPSQPTISRLENIADLKVLYRIGINNIDLFCRSYAAAPAAITLDIDDTDDLVHGGQQLALFNTHAGGHCFQPIHMFEGNSGKPILSLIRPGKRPSGAEIARVLKHVIHRIRRHWPKVSILVRGDGHYCAPEVLNLLRSKRCDYILGLPTNPKLEARSAHWHDQCRVRWKPGLARVRRFHQFEYAAGSWSHGEKVIARVEATALGTDVRFIVTNLPGRGKVLYEKVYCARGRMENMIKDLKLYTRSDKTACHRWQANQFRLFLHQGAYWLLHSLRLAASKKSRWRGATFATIRALLIKIACRVEELRTRIKLSFSAHLPHADALEMIAAGLRPQAP